MKATATHPAIEFVTAAVSAVAARCDTPTVVTLTGTGGAVTGRPEALPGGPVTAHSIAADARAWPG